MSTDRTTTSTNALKRVGNAHDEAITGPDRPESNRTALRCADYARLAEDDNVSIKAEDASDEDFEAICDSRYPESDDHLDTHSVTEPCSKHSTGNIASHVISAIPHDNEWPHRFQQQKRSHKTDGKTH